MTIWGAVLRMLGAAAGMLFLCLAVIWWQKNGVSTAYDERQQIARGQGYRFGFWVGAIYFACVIVYSVYRMMNLEEKAPAVDGYLLLFFGLVLELLAVQFYCLFTDAWLPFDQNPKSMIFVCLYWCVYEFGELRRSVSKYEGMPLMGEGSILWVHLTLMVTMLLLTISYLVVMLRKEKP